MLLRTVPLLGRSAPLTRRISVELSGAVPAQNADFFARSDDEIYPIEYGCGSLSRQITLDHTLQGNHSGMTCREIIRSCARPASVSAAQQTAM